MVKARGLTERDILDALRGGDFYSTCGPTFGHVGFDPSGRLHVRCSEARTIKLISINGRGPRGEAEPGHVLTGATFDWDWDAWIAATPYLRIECVDAQGRSAWTQAAFRPDREA